jgi:hypothetical protein
MLAAHVNAKGQRLQAKIARSSKSMLLLMPAGTGRLNTTPDRSSFPHGDAGLAEWMEKIQESTGGFTEAQRTEGTSKAHEGNMCLISEWSESCGLGAVVRKAEPDDKLRFRNIAPILDEAGQPVVLLPEAILAMMSQMATGDERMQKHAWLGKRGRDRQAEEKRGEVEARPAKRASKATTGVGMLHVNTLKELLSERGLLTTGAKPALVARLEQSRCSGATLQTKQA